MDSNGFPQVPAAFFIVLKNIKESNQSVKTAEKLKIDFPAWIRELIIAGQKVGEVAANGWTSALGALFAPNNHPLSM